MARSHFRPSRRPDKKNKVIQLLREGETSSVIPVDKVKTSVAYSSVVKNELLKELIRSKEQRDAPALH
ncbi:MAG: hypothetical protein QUS33_10330 [Dehalococcoidia bacterium]|nr:hypothetical protein [Dehalococcoidia bacterium]